MNEKQAILIVKDANGLTPKPYSLLESEAKGYLEAIEKAKELEEALKDIGVAEEHGCRCDCSNQRIDVARTALAKWEKDK